MAFDLDRRSLLLAFGAAGLPFPALAATSRSDPELVRTLLTTQHPGLYRYQTPAEFGRRHAAFVRAWDRAPSLDARFVAPARPDSLRAQPCESL